MSGADPHSSLRGPLRIVVVDQHPVFRGGLTHELEGAGGMRVVGEAGTGQEALEQVELKRPDIVVLDVELPDMPGLELLPRLARRAGSGNPLRVLILAARGDVATVERAFAAGADGYLLKEASARELFASISALAAGERYVFPPLGAMLAGVDGRESPDPLSIRELAIARMLGLGHTNQEVAASMFLSVRTIETNRAHVMAKLGIAARSELTRWVLERGLLEEPVDQPQG